MTNDQLHNFLFASIISADNESLEEEVKQEIIKRYRENQTKNWDYIFEPIPDISKKSTYVHVFSEDLDF